ncbi:SDR family oxidoreductase [Halobacillus massiliensis]|uniref:SDR family oxidoreductase n=1 Tax=Halobacillus massiliensis TaxID=1926286 RepID=UPI0009E4E61F|nr:SDR family oxidoreductase [Halobacillus massiliensis]
MRVLVIGANGKVGKNIVQKLMENGHEPVAMVRDTDQVPYFEEQGASTVLANLEKEIDHAFYNIDAVIFAAGSGPNTGPDKTILIDQEGAIKSIEKAKAYGVQRFIMLSSMAADRPESAPVEIRHYLFAKHRADEHVRQAGINYTIVRPGMLTNDKGTGKVTLKEHIDDFGDIPREDVAAAIVHLLEVPESEQKSYDLVSGDQLIEDIR